jgi:hypothetical protein
MKDLFRFVARGSIGSLILSLFSVMLLFILLFGPSGVFAVIKFPQTFLGAIPGAIVGVVLWFLTGEMYSKVGPLRRMIFGAATAIATFIALTVYYVANSYYYYRYYDYLTFQSLFWTLSYSFLQGALAGLICPARRTNRRKHNLPTERNGLYETDQANSAAQQTERSAS